MRISRFTDAQTLAIHREADRDKPAFFVKRHKVNEKTISA